MAETTLNCPACKSTLRLAQEVPEGRKVKCPKCGITFAPGEELVDEGVVADEPTSRSRPRDDDDYDDRPRRRRRDDDYDDYDNRPRRRSREKPRSMVATLLIFAAIVLVPVVLLGGLFLLFKGLSQPDKGYKLPENAQAPPNLNNQNQGGQPNQGQQNQGKKAAPSGDVGLAEGDTAPDIVGEDIDGKQFKLSDYRGKVVLLDFWGHW